MDIVYRKLESKDSQSILEFFNELKEENALVSFAEETDINTINSYLTNENMFLYVAEVNNDIAGVFRAKKGEEPWKKHSVVLTCAIKSKYRGKGIAKSLTDYSLDEIKKEGVKIARAYIYSDNPSSINTILKCGFTFSGAVHMHHYCENQKRYVDDLIFHKILV